MKIVYVLPGSGDTFYCENCLRDVGAARALREAGCDVTVVPMYLPVAQEPGSGGHRVFFGAVSTYLGRAMPGVAGAPRWIRRILDSRPALRLAAGMAGSTRASGLEKMTLAMLVAEEEGLRTELARLASWLRQEIRPDVIHLSNGLLLGLADTLHQETGAPVVCSLQDEHTWIEPMRGTYPQQVWEAVRRGAKSARLLLPVSRYYAEYMSERLGVDRAQMRVVRVGVNAEGYTRSSLPTDPPVLGYLARITASNGLDRLVASFLALRREQRWQGLKLRISGGAVGDDRRFVRKIRRRIRRDAAAADVRIEERFSGPGVAEMLSGLTLLSVPRECGEALGTFLLEAMAGGVPVVEPACGGFVELVA